MEGRAAYGSARGLAAPTAVMRPPGAGAWRNWAAMRPRRLASAISSSRRTFATASSSLSSRPKTPETSGARLGAGEGGPRESQRGGGWETSEGALRHQRCSTGVGRATCAGCPRRPRVAWGNLWLSATPVGFRPPFWAKSGRISAKSGRCRPNPARFRPNSDRIRPRFGQMSRVLPNLVEIEFQLRPTVPNVGRGEFGGAWSDAGQQWF